MFNIRRYVFPQDFRWIATDGTMWWNVFSYDTARAYDCTFPDPYSENDSMGSNPSVILDYGI